MVKSLPAPPRGAYCPPGPPLLFGEMAPATLEISMFSGNLLKIPPGAAFGGAHGAFRAPGVFFNGFLVKTPPPRGTKRPGGAAEGGARGYFHWNSGENVHLESFLRNFPKKQGGPRGSLGPLETWHRKHQPPRVPKRGPCEQLA